MHLLYTSTIILSEAITALCSPGEIGGSPVAAGRVWETAFLGGLLMREIVPDRWDDRSVEVRQTVGILQILQPTDMPG